MKTNLFCLVIIFLFGNRLIGQNLGYLGKKVFVDYNILSPFSFENGFLFIHKTDLNFVMSKNLVLNVNYEYQDNNAKYLGRIKSKGFGINTFFYMFKKGNIAPIGLYFGPGFLLTNYEISYKDNDDLIISVNNFYIVYFTIGCNRIIKDHLTINWGMQFGFPSKFEKNQIYYLARPFLGAGFIF